MNITDSNISCGVGQLCNINDAKPKDVMEFIANDFFDPYFGKVYPLTKSPFAFLIWSDVFGRNNGGNRLFHYIRKLFPDSHINRTMTAKNPNSGNTICVYTWKIPRGFRKWCEENIFINQTNISEYYYKH